MDVERERIERAQAKNLAYIQQQDEQHASRAVDELLSFVQPSGKRCKGNSSVYITGLTTYMACRQLEGVCSKLGKVRRVKFYKDEKGGLKGDAVVTFASRTTMAKAIERLNHFEIKPGVIITATEATFPTEKTTKMEENKVDTFAQVRQESMEVATVSLPLKMVTDDTPRLDLPSRSLVLKHIWDPLEGSDAVFFNELEDDMRSECGKYGAVENVQIVADGSVVLRFVELSAAIACLKVMNGRWFAGRQIEAQFDQSTAEDPGDEDIKVEAFLATLGE